MSTTTTKRRKKIDWQSLDWEAHRGHHQALADKLGFSRQYITRKAAQCAAIAAGTAPPPGKKGRRRNPVPLVVIHKDGLSTIEYNTLWNAVFLGFDSARIQTTAEQDGPKTNIYRKETA